MMRACAQNQRKTTPMSRQGIRTAHRFEQQLTQPLQHLIPNLMAVAMVDLL